tara:strand:+ start:2375 stop:3286 length:912 start_codon:yes stop_codon:yes gene_type:complete
MAKIGIIGGTGFTGRTEINSTVKTDYGPIEVGRLGIGGKEVAFVARHGNLEVPHLVNYRANIQALKMQGVDKIYAVSAAGRLHESVWPGKVGTITDVDWDDLDRVMTYAESGLLLHASMDQPFSEALNSRLHEAWGEIIDKVQYIYRNSEDLQPGFFHSGTYFNIQGPAFTTPAREARIRATMEAAGTEPRFIGQTLVPEVQLAREMGMAYAALAMCVDHSNFPDAPPVHHADGVMHAVQKTAQVAYHFLEEAIKITPEDLHDPAHEAFSHSLHSSQVDLGRLRIAGRINLAVIIEAELESRK